MSKRATSLNSIKESRNTKTLGEDCYLRHSLLNWDPTDPPGHPSLHPSLPGRQCWDTPREEAENETTASGMPTFLGWPYTHHHVSSSCFENLAVKLQREGERESASVVTTVWECHGCHGHAFRTHPSFFCDHGTCMALQAPLLSLLLLHPLLFT